MHLRLTQSLLQDHLIKCVDAAILWRTVISTFVS